VVKWFVRYIACVDERSDGGMPDASFEQANNQMKGMAVRLASIRISLTDTSKPTTCIIGHDTCGGDAYSN